jgi:hypothetical protein
MGILDVVLKVGTNTLSRRENISIGGKNILPTWQAFFCLSVMNIFATYGKILTCKMKSSGFFCFILEILANSRKHDILHTQI